MTDMVISGSDVTFGLLEELMKQLKAGAKTSGRKGITGAQFRAFLEHRNLFERVEVEKVLPYADEEVESNFGYPKEFRIRSVREQVETLLTLDPFKNLDASHVAGLAGGELHDGSEGWAVIPKLSKVAENYHQALDIVLGLISADRQFQNWRKGELTEKHLRLTEKTKVALSKLEEDMPGDFLVIPFQFGLKHRGKSVRRARVLFAENEFGLGAYEMAVLLLTHPGRITGSGQLYVDCAGVEYAPRAGGDFLACLDFDWDDKDELLALYYSFSSGYVYEQWGSCSGFLAQ